MRQSCARWGLVALAGTCFAFAQPAAPDQPLTLEQKEEFLLKAKILKIRPINKGVTESNRATLQDGERIHDAHVQSIDESKSSFTNNGVTELNFRDSYKYNIAAYRLAKMLGISDMIPPSVQRKVTGRTSAVTWWVDGVLMDEADRVKKGVAPPDQEQWNHQMEIVRVFDQLIYNVDRNLQNLLITKDWRVIIIDHTRAFRRMQTLRIEANLTRCDRGLFRKLGELNKKDMNDQLKPWLMGVEIDGILARRDLILRHFKAAVEKSGEDAVFFDRKVQ